MTTPGASPGEEQPKLPSGTFMPMVSLRKHWPYGLAVALVVGSLGGVVAWSKRDKFVYSVMAKVRIAPRFSTVLTEQKETDLESFQKWRQFQEQQAIKVKQYDTVLEALKTLNMGRTTQGLPLIWLRPNEDVEVDETPFKQEVDRLSKQWKKTLRQEENKRLESLKDQEEETAQAADQYEFDESSELDNTDEPMQQQAEPGDLREAKMRLKEARDKNEIRLRGAAERLAEALQTATVKDSYLMNISLEQTMKTQEKMPLDVIVNQVVQTYMDKTKGEAFYSDKDARILTLNNRRQQLDKMISKRMAQRIAIAQELGVTTFIENMINPFDQLLLDSKVALAVAERELIVAKSAEAVFVDEQGREKREALDAASSAIVAQDPTLNTLKGNVNLRRTKLLEAISGLEDTHPLKKNIDRELKEVDEELSRGTEEVSKRVGRALVLQRKAEVTKAQGVVNGIIAQIRDSMAKAQKFSEGYNKALGYNSEIRRYQNQLEKIENRKDELMIESKAPSMVRWESKALPPEKGKGGSTKFAIISAVASIVLGLIVPILIDMFKRYIQTTNQVQNLLGRKPLAGLYEPSEDIGRRMVTADIKRRLATALEREHQLHGTRLFLLTSVKPGAGVTSLAFELALEFGDLGVKALVVEVNASKPDTRYQADQFQNGLIDLINGEGSIEEAITKADGLLPDRVCVGGYHIHSHLFGYDKLREILVALQSTYDVVLLDAPPILISADSEFLAAMADHTLLLIKARDVFPGELIRAAKILEEVSPKAISFIVTNLEVFKGGGYFAQREKEYNVSHEKAKHTVRSRTQKKQDAISGMKPIFLYALHSGNLYGTERMALYALDAFRDVFTPVLLAPPGPALVEAEKMGIQAVPFHNARDFARRLRHQMSDHRQIAFAATGVTHSWAFNFWNLFYRRSAVHLHLVHGGTDERESYGRKKWLNRLKVTFIAVSEYVQARLIANGVNPAKIVVVGNYLPDKQIQEAPRHPPFAEDGIRKVVVVSRVDPIKRIDLLLDALDRHPELCDLPVRVFGTGWDLDLLRTRAQESHPNVVLEGFSAEVAGELAAGDLLLHLCPVEPFGLAILEAMAAGVPVLVPDHGGAAGLVEEGVSGFHFRADNADDLAATLAKLRLMPAEELNRIVNAADQRLQENYSSSACLENYRKLFTELLDG